MTCRASRICHSPFEVGFPVFAAACQHVATERSSPLAKTWVKSRAQGIPCEVASRFRACPIQQRSFKLLLTALSSQRILVVSFYSSSASGYFVLFIAASVRSRDLY